MKTSTKTFRAFTLALATAGIFGSIALSTVAQAKKYAPIPAPNVCDRQYNICPSGTINP